MTTGIGAVHNTAKVQPGDSVAILVWGNWSGCGTGARQAKAGRIIAIDTNPTKFDWPVSSGPLTALTRMIMTNRLKMFCWISTSGVLTIPLNVSVTLTSCVQRWKVLTVGGAVRCHWCRRGRTGDFHPSFPAGHRARMERFRVWRSKGRTQLPGMVEDAMKGILTLSHL